MKNAQSRLFTPLNLPNGQQLPNRLCKAAMEENLSEWGQLPGEKLFRLYQQWAAGGAGLLLTGNVMVAPDALTGPGGVVLQQGTNLAPFKQWAEAGRSGRGHLWMQISHPGRQLYASMQEQAVSASDVALEMGSFSKMFAKPKALSSDEIEALIERFATTASLAEEAGFTGVQIHAAHGYLISQFLSPLSNQRDDKWGGSLENRARFLFETVQAVRARVKADFCVAVKLNSADFQKGGFDQQDAKWVVEQLENYAVDLVELSGGSFESPAMQGQAKDDSSSLREAYFIDFAREIAKVATMPVMVTGGIRSLAVAEAAMENKDGFGVSVLGIARALAFKPDLPNAWRNGESSVVTIPEVNWSNKTVASLAAMGVAKAQLERLAAGKEPKATISPLVALVAERLRTRKRTKRYVAWRQSTQAASQQP